MALAASDAAEGAGAEACCRHPTMVKIGSIAHKGTPPYRLPNKNVTVVSTCKICHDLREEFGHKEQPVEFAQLPANLGSKLEIKTGVTMSLRPAAAVGAWVVEPVEQPDTFPAGLATF